MDIEWAKDGRNNELYIVQARPETIHSQADKSKIRTYEMKVCLVHFSAQISHIHHVFWITISWRVDILATDSLFLLQLSIYFHFE